MQIGHQRRSAKFFDETIFGNFRYWMFLVRRSSTLNDSMVCLWSMSWAF